MQSISNDDLFFLSLFSEITGISAKNFKKTEQGYVFLVDSNELERARGKNNYNLKKLKELLNTHIYIFADSQNIQEFISNIFYDVKILKIDIKNGKSPKEGRVAFITVNENARGIAIGKDGWRIKLAKELLKDKFGISVAIRTQKIKNDKNS